MTAIESKKEFKRGGYLIFILVTRTLIFRHAFRIETWVICLTGALVLVN